MYTTMLCDYLDIILRCVILYKVARFPQIHYVFRWVNISNILARHLALEKIVYQYIYWVENITTLLMNVQIFVMERRCDFLLIKYFVEGTEFSRAQQYGNCLECWFFHGSVFSCLVLLLQTIVAYWSLSLRSLAALWLITWSRLI